MYTEPGAGRFEIALTMGNRPRQVIGVEHDRHDAEVRARELGQTARAVDLGTGDVYVPSLKRWIQPDTAAVADRKTEMVSPSAGQALAALMFDLGADMMRLQAEGYRNV